MAHKRKKINLIPTHTSRTPRIKRGNRPKCRRVVCDAVTGSSVWSLCSRSGSLAASLPPASVLC